MTLQVLREELDCQLPVEVIYNGPLEMTHEVLARSSGARPCPAQARHCCNLQDVASRSQNLGLIL